VNPPILKTIKMENLSQQELIDRVLSGQLTQEEFDNLIYKAMENM